MPGSSVVTKSLLSGICLLPGPVWGKEEDPVPGTEVRLLLDDGQEIRGEFTSWNDNRIVPLAPGRTTDAEGWRMGLGHFFGRDRVEEVWSKTGRKRAVGRRLGKAATVTGGRRPEGAGKVIGWWDRS